MPADSAPAPLPRPSDSSSAPSAPPLVTAAASSPATLPATLPEATLPEATSPATSPATLPEAAALPQAQAPSSAFSPAEPAPALPEALSSLLSSAASSEGASAKSSAPASSAAPAKTGDAIASSPSLRVHPESSSSGFFKSILGALRFVASAIIGPPMAAAASVFLIAAAATVTAMNLCWSVAIPKGFGKELRFDQGLDKAQKALWGALKKTWTGFGAQAYLKTSKFISGNVEAQLAYNGPYKAPPHPSGLTLPPRTRSFVEKKQFEQYGAGPKSSITNAEAEKLDAEEERLRRLQQWQL